MSNANALLAFARETLEIELTEAQRLLARLDDNFVCACELLLNCRGKAVISGIGKSGHIGKKIAASLASTGTPSFFVHPAEALHGDLGMIGADDVVVFISYSGRAKAGSDPAAAGGERHSGNRRHRRQRVAAGAGRRLRAGYRRRARSLPDGAGTDLQRGQHADDGRCLGDGADAPARFQRGRFRPLAPGRQPGARLLNRVHHLMRTGDRLPRVSESANVMEAMLELSRTGLGLVAVCDAQRRVVGVFTDGDLRRWLVKGNSLQDPLSPAITRPGYRLPEQWRAGEALEALHEQHISAAPVVDMDGVLVGALNLHDLHQAGIG